MSTKYAPLPTIGDIVWCHFPQEMGVPGPKPRPALVRAVSTARNLVQVAYGTSKKTGSLYPGEFVLDPSDGGFADSGLEVRTKFDVGNLVTLPFDDTWFAPSPLLKPGTPAPKMGSLHVSYLTAAIKARETYKDYQAKKAREALRLANDK
ncbi:hypothetical protein [Gluconobacter kondonii]|uniref:hypothetical protein n=1 Tax=Gluconobacter kondonii TaxID=941463 RepID=UPI001B8B9556|nr:hypothetical protein [Gluconobacter kondonii]MBS1054940.1 hypothetical protein [Gluconobacter kondonii]